MKERYTTTFDKVLKALRTGKYLAKRLDLNWIEKHKLIKIKDGHLLSMANYPCREYIGTSTDLMAEDWVLRTREIYKD